MLDLGLAMAVGYLWGAGEPLAGVSLVVVYIVAFLVRRWWRGRQGLDQWPHPYGRYYSEWMALKRTRLNYYQWLAARKGD